MTDSRNPATRLTRSVDDSVFAGVCGGLGEQFGINAWWFRWAFIVLTLFGFAGVFLYILAWILIPKETDDESVATSWLERLDLTDIGTIFGVVLIGVAGVIVLSQFFDVGGGLVAAGVLAIIGVLLYRGDLRPPEKPDDATRHYLDEDESEASTASFSDTSDAPTPADAPSTGASAVAVADGPVAAKPVKAPKPRQPKSMLGRLTMAAALIVLSTMAIVELTDAYHFQPIDYVAAGMVVVALGLIVGAWIGRARWLIVIGILLAPWLFFTAFLPDISIWSAGDPVYRPDSIEETRTGYELGAGQLTLDLTNLSASELEEVGTISVEVGMGQLIVQIPADVGVVVEAEVGMGSIENRRLRGSGIMVGDRSERYSGIAVDQHFEVGPPPYTVELDLEVGMGEISIRRELPVDSDGTEG